MDYRKYKNLFESVASRLARRPVLVCFRKPVIIGALGTAGLDIKHGAFVDISPDLSEKEILEVFLHEVAHVRLHFSDKKPYDYANIPPQSYKPDAAYLKKHAKNPKEIEADRLALKWLEYADKNRAKWAIDLTEARLKALDSWFSPETEAAIERIVDMTLKIYSERT